MSELTDHIDNTEIRVVFSQLQAKALNDADLMTSIEHTALLNAKIALGLVPRQPHEVGEARKRVLRYLSTQETP